MWNSEEHLQIDQTVEKDYTYLPYLNYIIILYMYLNYK